MKAILKFWTVLLCAGLVIGGCCDDPIAPEIPDTGDEDDPPVGQPETPLTDGSLFTAQLNDDIMATVGTGDWNAIAYGNGKYVAVGEGSDIAYSENGTDWTIVRVPMTSASIYDDITYGNGKFVAVQNGPGSGAVYSTDGITWSKIDDITGGYYTGLAYGNGKFVATRSIPPQNHRVSYSGNGLSWTEITVDFSVNALAYGNGKFVAVGNSGLVVYSTDGINWETVDSGTTKTLNCVYVL